MSTYDKLDRPCVIAYVGLLQGIISRMASNSANCKVCAVTILTAVLALSNYDGCEKCLIAAIPTFLMFLTDSYYLGLERRFKRICDDFIARIKEGQEPDLFSIPKSSLSEQLIGLLGGFRSISTTPFYLLLGLASLVFSFV
ncbi:hypothetical protein [Parabacteroides sp. ZJ-118]|uniref:hypothetical protein n=1 Tax=Parabacteroides sp. ZJ-118 TaxID=2709398 RepID=UPI0013EC3090|nr:hypothetical protein [Parabacteroides sp. ZJ-118]